MDKFDKRELEESFLVFRNVIPRSWWNVYQGCLEVGFDSHQAMALLETYILSQNSKGIVPPGEGGPKSDDPEHQE